MRVGHLPLFPSMGSFGSRRLSSSYLSAIPVIDLIYRGKKVEGFMVTRAFAKLGPGPLELLKYKPLSQHTGTTKGRGLARTGTHTEGPSSRTRARVLRERLVLTILKPRRRRAVARPGVARVMKTQASLTAHWHNKGEDLR